MSKIMYMDNEYAGVPSFISDSNYCKMPDGTLIQWGVVALSANASWARATFSVSFVNTDYSVIGIIKGSPITPTAVGSKAVSSADINTTASSYARSIEWIAVGRWE